MDSRSSSTSAVRIFQAFLRQRTWPQAALAREVGIGAAQLKRLLEGLEQDGVLPLEREVDHPHVYWSLPKGWFPGGVFYQGSEVESLLRLLARSPKSKERDKLISIAGQCFLGRRDTRQGSAATGRRVATSRMMDRSIHLGHP
ncbi:MAG: hypothetical protein U1E65_21765 [Myxococcota bacterium]